MEQKEKQIITLRIEKELVEKIDQAANEQQRDRTKQIIYIIKQYFEMQDKFR